MRRAQLDDLCQELDEYRKQNKAMRSDLTILRADREADQGEIKELRAQVREWKERYTQLNTEWQWKYDALKMEFEQVLKRTPKVKKLTGEIVS